MTKYIFICALMTMCFLHSAHAAFPHITSFQPNMVSDQHFYYINNFDDDLLNAAQGKWWSSEYKYGFEIEGLNGVATATNAPNVYKVGDHILQINHASHNKIKGKQIFTDGAWYDVTITVHDAFMYMEGGGYKWTLRKQDE